VPSDHVHQKAKGKNHTHTGLYLLLVPPEVGLKKNRLCLLFEQPPGERPWPTALTGLPSMKVPPAASAKALQTPACSTLLAPAGHSFDLYSPFTAIGTLLGVVVVVVGAGGVQHQPLPQPGYAALRPPVKVLPAASQTCDSWVPSLIVSFSASV